MGIQELYYEEYAPGKYRPKSLPFQLSIGDPENKKRLVGLLEENGFVCVSPLSLIPQSLYVNFTLKRYGGAYKAASSSSINCGMMSYENFMKNVWEPYQTIPEVKAILENNWIQSAAIELSKTYSHLIDVLIHYPKDEYSKAYDSEHIRSCVRQIMEYGQPHLSTPG